MSNCENKYFTQSPILFMFFNRYDTSKLVIEAIKNVRPKKIYLASDGARSAVENEKNVVDQIRNLILSSIDWQCDVHTLFQNNNLGCKHAVTSAINWFFKNESQGIILEDDCLPNNDFFRFCDQMLEKYKDNNNIGHISGTNFHSTFLNDGDYYFSKLTHVWGWATWRRAWLKYDIDMKDLDLFVKADKLKEVTDNYLVKHFMYNLFYKTKNGHINTWDYQYLFSNLNNNYISIQSNYNLVSNIGFDGNGTHTNDINSPFAKIPLSSMPIEISHPTSFRIEKKADNIILKLETPSLLSYIKYAIKKYFINRSK